ncbi:MAG: hypothetical protein V7672_03300 [Brevundimonas sp.]|uniref:hypothetical protein n=1 Tax=Brevundimonas sp. TaxID=1871086 RepID=UPI0030011299
MQMRHLVAGFVGLAALVVAGSASAQSTGGTGGGTGGGAGPQIFGRSTGRITAPTGRMTQAQYLFRYESESARRDAALNEQSLVQQHGADRVDLAYRVGALVDLGRCREARAMAFEEGDRRMAMRVRQICRGL